MLIKAYGTFWNPDLVEWGSVGAGNRGQLLGWVTKDDWQYEIDFWQARGVYVLLSDFKAVYVGKALDTAIGKRLRDHLTDRLAGRWDMFSWFSVSGVKTTTFDVSAPGQRQVQPKDMIDMLEAVAIIVADPALNRRWESLSGALVASQPENAKPKTVRHYLEEVLARLDPESK